MIFVCTGSQKFPFNRLLAELDRLLETGAITEPVTAQTGYSDYVPRRYAYSRFYDKEEFGRQIDSAEIIISHGGCGSIMSALERGKKVIAVPRRANFGEHINDHQIQLIDTFAKENYLLACPDPSGLERALAEIRSRTFRPFSGGSHKVADDIAYWLSSLS